MLTILWRRTPFVLLTRFLQIFVAITTAAMVLSAIAASGPLFLQSSETASLQREIPEDIAAGQQHRDGIALDRRRLLVAEPGEGVEQLGSQPQLAEPGHQAAAR